MLKCHSDESGTRTQPQGGKDLGLGVRASESDRTWGTGHVFVRKTPRNKVRGPGRWERGGVCAGPGAVGRGGPGPCFCDEAVPDALWAGRESSGHVGRGLRGAAVALLGEPRHVPAGLSVRVFWAKYSLHLDGEYSSHRLRGCHAGPEPRPRPGPLSRERSPAPSCDARAPGLLLGLSSFAEMCRSCRELNERNGSFPCWPLSLKLASAASLLGRAMRSAARVHVRVCTPACVCPRPGRSRHTARARRGPRQPRGGRVREPPGRRGPGFLLGKGAAAGERGAPLAPRLPAGGPGSGGEAGAEG